VVLGFLRRLSKYALLWTSKSGVQDAAGSG